MTRASIGASLVALVLCGPTIVAADNTTAQAARFLMPGEKQTDAFDATLTDRWYVTNLVASRSYAVYAWAPDEPAGSADLAEIAFFTDAGVTPAEVVETADQEVDISFSLFNHTQTKIIPTTSGAHWLRLSTVSAPTAAYDVSLILVETTLYSPWGFIDDTSAYQAILQIRNNTSSPVTVHVTVYDGTGAAGGIPYQITLQGNANASVSVGPDLQVSGTGGQSGSAQLSHTGPPGALSANMTTLSATTGLSPDAPFTPRMQWGPLGNR